MELDYKLLNKSIRAALMESKKADDILETHLEQLGQRPPELEQLSEKLYVAFRALRGANQIASGLKPSK